LRRIWHDALHDARVSDPDRPMELVAPAPVTVAGDRDRLVQVAHNLVRNAIVHTPRGSPVRVEIGAEDGMGVVKVVDAGPGLAPGQLSRVFDRFYRADPSRTGSGSGLGLSIVRAIAEALGGRAWAEPGAGGGTVFGVAVPLFEGATGQGGEPLGTAPGVRKAAASGQPRAQAAPGRPAPSGRLTAR